MNAETKIAEAQRILHDLGLPEAQQNEISALTLLALCGITPTDSWAQTDRRSLTITKGIMAFISQHYGRTYAPNTRETIRRQVLHQFVQARIADYNPDNPALPTNSPRAHYALTSAARDAIRQFGTNSWPAAAARFVQQHGSLADAYNNIRTLHKEPVHLRDGRTVYLSPGRHNELQVAIVNEFGPRFVRDSILVYLGDTAKKNLIVDHLTLTQLGVQISEHSKLPDVVFYDRARNWLVLVEAVTSHGPMTPKRVRELKAMLTGCTAGLVFVSAFPDEAELKKHLKDIAWETEVWLANHPDHMIHLNGDRFMGPRQ